MRIRKTVILALLLAVYLSLGQAGHRFLTGVLGEEPARVPGYNIYVGFNPDTQGSYSEEDMVTILQTITPGTSVTIY